MKFCNYFIHVSEELLALPTGGTETYLSLTAATKYYTDVLKCQPTFQYTVVNTKFGKLNSVLWMSMLVQHYRLSQKRYAWFNLYLLCKMSLRCVHITLSLLCVFILYFFCGTKISFSLNSEFWGFFVFCFYSSYLFDMLSCINYALLVFQVNVQTFAGTWLN